MTNFRPQEIGSGSSGKVFTTEDPNVVVKIGSIRHLLTELDFLSQIDSDTVARLEEFSTEIDLDFSGRRDPEVPIQIHLFLRRGVPLMSALKNASQVNVLPYIGDLLNIFGHFREQGLVHADIKPHNMVMIDDKIAIIDFGLSTREVLGTYEGLAYTGPYRDPNYLAGARNYVATEAFAVGKTIEAMVRGTSVYENQPITTGQEEVDSLLGNLLNLDPDQRWPISKLAAKYQDFGGRDYFFRKRVEEETFFSIPEQISARNWYSMVGPLIGIVSAHDLPIRIVFVALTNFRRCLSLCYKENRLETTWTMALVGLINLYLADYSMVGTRTLAMEDLLDGVDSISRRDFISKLAEVLKHLGGRISTTTLWDQALQKRGKELTVIDLLTCLHRLLAYDTPFDNRLPDSFGTAPIGERVNLDFRIRQLNAVFAKDSQWLKQSYPVGGFTLENVDPENYVLKDYSYQKPFLFTSRPTPEQVAGSYHRLCLRHPEISDIYDEMGFIWASLPIIRQQSNLANRILYRFATTPAEAFNTIYLLSYDVIWGDWMRRVRRDVNQLLISHVVFVKKNLWLCEPKEIEMAVREYISERRSTSRSLI